VLDTLSNPSQCADWYDSSSVNFVRGSTNDKELIENLVENHDIVFHLAAIVGVEKVISDPQTAFYTNVIGTQTVCDASQRYGKRLFIASSSEVYGISCNEILKEEDCPGLNATRTTYGLAKYISEQIALDCFRNCGLSVTILRYFSVVGSGQQSSTGMVVPRFIKQASMNHEMTVFGCGLQKRTFIYVGNAVRATVGLINCEAAIGSVYNIGGDEETDIFSLALMVKNAMGSSSPIKCIDYDKSTRRGWVDAQRRRPDCSKIEKILGYQLKGDLQRAVEEAIECSGHKKHSHDSW
jgi:UDP-glucose 4-epimerase